MTIDDLIKKLPDEAKDIRLNFLKLFQPEGVTISEEASKAIIYAVSISVAQTDLIKEISHELQEQLNENYVKAAKIASALMSMNNIYYRFIHLSEDKALQMMAPGLRMQGMTHHGIDTKLFELMCLAISAVNGCGMCIQSHIKTLRREGARDEDVQYCAKVAAVIHALAHISVN